jgi:predicted metal-dependent peptidase
MKIKNPEAYKHMRNARARLCFFKTYFGTALWALKFVEVENLIQKAGAPLAADQYWRVYYDPEFVLKCNLKVLMAGLLHELGHLVRGHHDRAIAAGIQAINHRPWNVAGDLELNDDLEKDSEVDMAGLPWDYISPTKMKLPEEKMAEWYYNQMPKKELPNPNCGSAASGVPQEWEKEGDKQGADKVGKAEGKLIQKHVADTIKHSKTRGSIPGGWQRWAETFGQPVVNWRSQLSALIRNRLAQVYGNFDYSYSKANRRQRLYGKILMPAMIQPVPKLATVIDTSGSMGAKDLSMALTEIKGILTAVGIGEVTNYVVDAECHGGRKITSVADIELKGGGGTDMRVGISKAIEEARGDLDVVIVLTDGYTPWPDEEPRTKVIAVLTQKDAMSSLPPHIKGVCIA